jgi:hypothetical protein
VLIVAVCVSGFWYARDAAVWGNPIYPSGITLFGVRVWRGVDWVERAVGRVSVGQLTGNLRDLGWDRMWDRLPIRSGQTEYGTGFGPMAAGLGVAAAVGLWLTQRGGRRGRWAVLWTAGTLVVLCASTSGDAFTGRFFMFLPLCAAVFVAMLGPTLPRGVPRGLWTAMLGVSVAMSGWTSLTLAAPAQVWRAWWSGTEVRVEPLLSAQQAALLTDARRAPPGAPLVVYIVAEAEPLALLHGPNLRRQLIYIHHVPTAADLRRWHRAGATRVLSDVGPRGAASLRKAGLVPCGGMLYAIP